MKKVYLIRFSGDVTYRKASSRFYLENLVVRNIANALRANNFKAKLLHEPARVFLEGEINASILGRIFGISSYSECILLRFSNLEELSSLIEELYREKVKGKKIAVKCRRSGTHDFTSMDVAREVGAKLRPYASKVDLENPDITIYIEIRDDRAYVYEETIKGVGGLPIGSGDLVLSLFSGGFDSPVASWLVAKRGCKIDFLHFSLAGMSDVMPVLAVAKYLQDNWFYGYKSRFFVIRFSGIVREIMSKLSSEIFQVALRRCMYLAAEELAKRLGHEALVTGEAIAQATSQTIRNLRVAEEGISLPIIRPLIGFDKQEIIEKSKGIGTYELSLEVEEFCSIAIGPLTAKADINTFFNEMEKINKNIIYKSVDNVIELDLSKSLENIKNEIKEDEFVIDYIPSDAIIVNLMPDKFQIKNAISFSEFDEEKYKGSLVIFVCEKGLTSKGLARQFREEGYKAYSLAGGFEGYKKLISSK